ncbi:hypothetical protein CEXT_81671 [Caerostris extrusa]|uniref:Uncharacterized protein n=1 Tax=Caerostris extrusa TaxID=172846 RepID=A0AAV4SCC2_CAEEX|nr:hypothetical protein CEXT_81671 [Caerostris extrusa]
MTPFKYLLVKIELICKLGYFIEHQSNFRLLSEEQLRFYPNLEKLTVQNSGLSVITANAFAFTRRLREM